MGRAVRGVDGRKAGVNGEFRKIDNKRNYKNEFYAMNNITIMIK